MKNAFFKKKEKNNDGLIMGVIAGTLLVTGAAIYFNSQTIPHGVKAIKPFDAKKFLGKWHEIARLDYRFEKNLDNVTANYSLNEDGTIKVVNSGYNYKKSEKQETTGVAKFVDSPDEGKLKVSFWGPFYSGYNVIDIDKNYKYALIAGKNRNYLWILSRETSIPEDIKEAYLKKAESLGFKTKNLIWSEHK